MIIRLFTALLFLVSPAALTIHIVYKSNNPKASLSAAQIKFTNDILKTYDWPSSVNLLYSQDGSRKAKDFGKIMSELREKEALGGLSPWIEQKINNKYPDLAVLWVPNTVWDLFQLSDMHSTGHHPDDNQKSRRALVAKFLNKLVDMELLSQKISPDWSDKGTTKDFVLELLDGFKKVVPENEIFPARALAAEHKLVSRNASMIPEAVDAEVTAHQNQKVVFFRATQGVQLTRKGTRDFDNLALDFLLPKVVAKDPDIAAHQKAYNDAVKYLFDEIKKDPTKPIALIIQSMPQNWQDAFTKAPQPAAKPSPKDMNIESIIADLPNTANSKSFEAFDLSFSYSLFSGCGSTEDDGVCTYLYAIKNSRFLDRPILYTVELPVQFLLTRGKQLFYLPHMSPDLLVTFFGLSIFSHPRVRRIGEVRRQVDVGLGAEIFALGHLSPLKYEDKLGSQRNKKFLSFALEMQEILDGNTRVIAINGENIRSASQMKKAQSLIANQKLTTRMLRDATFSLVKKKKRVAIKDE